MRARGDSDGGCSVGEGLVVAVSAGGADAAVRVSQGGQTSLSAPPPTAHLAWGRARLRLRSPSTATALPHHHPPLVALGRTPSTAISSCVPPLDARIRIATSSKPL